MIMADETVPNEPTNTDTSAATTTPDPAPAEPKGDEAALAAMDEGIAEASESAPAAATPPAAKKPDDAPPATTAAADAAAATKPTDAAAAAEKPKPTEPDAEVEAEIKALRLKEKGAERFRAMAGEIKAFAPIKAALEKAGIKDAATFEQAMPQLVQRSKDFEDMVGMVTETGATPEMYSGMLDYMKDAVAGVNGDPEAAQRAYDRTLKELAAWGQLIGKEVPGVVDPLEGHADLKAGVENGDLSREYALELARQRNTGTMARGRIARHEQAAAQETAQAQGKQALNQLEAQLKASDPDYARKREFLLPAVRAIVAKYPPDQWAAAARQAYAEIPALPPVAAAAPAPARPTPGPVRGGARMSVAAIPKDPMEALEMGIAQASA
jgi:hypothetical protein